MEALIFRPLGLYPGKQLINFQAISLKGVGRIKLPKISMKELYQKSILYHFVKILTANVE